jgi:hypothetical protein
MFAIDEIAAERQRQIDAEGWTAEHDDTHGDGALTDAAAAYVLAAAGRHLQAEEIWPWDFSWWKPTLGPRRNLVKAGALIVAEIERLDRIAMTKVEAA